jgi:proteic killer suppression protein
MIASFRHKGLRQFFEDDSSKDLTQEHLSKIRRILTILHAAERIEDVNEVGLSLHALKGDLRDFWSVTVRANWRIVFRLKTARQAMWT